MQLLLIALPVHVVLSSMCIWLATVLSRVDLTMREISLIVLTITAFSFVPYIGFILSLIFFIFLVMRFSGCSAFDAAAVAIFTKIIALSGILIATMSLSQNW